jgi:hypothetical protein
MQDTVLNGRSSLFGAMLWMALISLLLSLLLGGVPVVGPFIGPLVGGYIGGRRAGSPGRGFLAAILPCVLLSLFFLAVGAFAAGMVGDPMVGGIFALLAGLAGVISFFGSLAMVVAAVIGGATRQSDPY